MQASTASSAPTEDDANDNLADVIAQEIVDDLRALDQSEDVAADLSER